MAYSSLLCHRLTPSHRLRALLLLLALFALLFIPLAAPSRADGPLLGEPPTAPAGSGLSGAGPSQAPVILGQAPRAPYFLFLPSVTRAGTWLDTQNRQTVVAFFNQEYLSYQGTPINWTGDTASCNPGTTDPAFRAAVARRINYFRAMAGAPANVTLLDVYNVQDQSAALMMSVNRTLNHNPPSSWMCYTTGGADAASHSNLYLGINGYDAVSGYIKDPGDGNSAVGHRRWILYPQTQNMGTGDIPLSGSDPPANALWVVDSAHLSDPRPATRDVYIAWPPPGYVPYQVVFPRWSFAYPGADFSAAAVTMTSGGSSVSVVIEAAFAGGGENTMVWIPLGMNNGGVWPPPPVDTPYTVNIQNVLVGGVPRSFSYTVTVINP